MLNKAIQRLLQFCFGPVDPIRLDVFGRVYSVTFLIYMIGRFVHAKEWLTDYGFHLTNEDKKFWHPDLFPTMPTWMIIPFGILLFGSILLHIIGWKPRVIIWVVFALAVYVQLVDILSAFTLNKLYILGYFVLAVGSLWNTYQSKSEEGKINLVSAWPMRVLQFTILIQLGTAGLCKVFHGDWIDLPMLWQHMIGKGVEGQSWVNQNVLWSQIQGVYSTEFSGFLLRILPKWMWSIQQHLALFFEVFAPLLIGIKKIRWVGFIMSAGFMLVIALTMYELTYFMLQLAAFLILFVRYKTLHRFDSMLPDLLKSQPPTK